MYHSTDHPHFKTVKWAEEKGSQVNRKHYATSHEKADQAEKKAYPSGYEDLKNLVRKVPKGELLGKVSKKGTIEVSKMVPSKERREVAYHEATEIDSLNKRKSSKKK
jgi:hypothetical protein